jgi:hypothetical protein
MPSGRILLLRDETSEPLCLLGSRRLLSSPLDGVQRPTTDVAHKRDLLRHARRVLLLAVYLASDQALGDQVSHWSSDSDREVYVIDSPDPPTLLAPLHHIEVPVGVGDTVFVHASGCVNSAITGWIPFLGGAATAPKATIWIPGNPDTGGASYNNTPLSAVVDTPLQVTSAAPLSFGKGRRVTIALGYDAGTPQVYSYGPGPHPVADCQQSPHAEITVSVRHSEATLARLVNAIPYDALTYRFDTWANLRLDPNGIGLNPIFNGQIERCQLLNLLAQIFGVSPLPLSTCLAQGYPYADEVCNGFPLLSTRADDRAPQQRFSKADEFANLIVTRLLKDVWAWNHGGEDLNCPELDYDPCFLAGKGKVCPRWATCDANDTSSDNRDNCGVCYFQPWQSQYYTGSWYPYEGAGSWVSDYSLKDDITQLSDLLSSDAFSALPLEMKLATISPIVWRWWPVIDTRWRFGDVKGTHTDSSGREENICRSSPFSTDTSSLCALGKAFYNNSAGAVDGLAGHVDFQPATYQGRMWIEAHSSPSPLYGGFGDDDMNWGLRPQYGEGSAGGERWLHVERSASTSLRKILAINPAGTDFWTGLARAIDQDNAAWITFNASNTPGSFLRPDENIIAYLEQRLPPLERTDVVAEPEISKRKIISIDAGGAAVESSEPYAMPATDAAIVIGNLGLDCYHGCTPELHPAYLIALRTKHGASRERWAFLADPTADEGFCSRRAHSLATTNRLFRFFIPREGATEVTISMKSLTEIHGRSSGTDLNTGELTQWEWSYVRDDNVHAWTQLIPGQGILVTLDLWPRGDDDPDTHHITTDAFDTGWIEGEVDVTWSPRIRRGLSLRVIDSVVEKYRRALEEMSPPRGPRPGQPTTGDVDALLTMAAQSPARLAAKTEEQAKRLAGLQRSRKSETGGRADPESILGPSMTRFLGRIKQSQPQRFNDYIAGLRALQVQNGKQHGLRPRLDGCQAESRVVVRGTILREVEKIRASAPKQRCENGEGDVIYGQSVGPGGSLALVLACSTFSSYADFPLAGACSAVASDFGLGSRDVQETTTATQPSAALPCPVDTLLGGACVKLKPGAKLAIDRLSRFAARISPAAFCSDLRPGDVVEVETGVGPVVAVAVGEEGTFVLLAADKGIESLFGVARRAYIERVADGRLLAARNE